jgi:hypothetical protein
MTLDSAALSLEEYRALRATIRERGTVRLVLAVVTFVAWAAMILLVQTVVAVPAFALVPLVVLAAGFEAVFAAHVGVERVGRYLQAFYEPGPPSLPMWEHVAMAGVPHPGSGARLDALFAGLFAAATLINLVPVVLLSSGVAPDLPGGLPMELGFYGLVHLLFLWRLLSAWRFASGQRRRDFEHFRSLRGRAER